jgi:hypothetical protein
MASAVLAIDASYDPATMIATGYRERFVLPLLNQGPFSLRELAGPNANPQSVAAMAGNPTIVYVTGVCHGTPDTFTGDHEVPIFIAGRLNPAFVKNRIFHFLACNTATVLGPNMTDPNVGGASAFFGYSGLFAWPAAADQYAAMFFDCDAEIDRCLAAGQTAGQAFANTVAKYNNEIAGLVQLGDSLSLKLAAALTCNLRLLRGPNGASPYGNPNARIA